MVLPVRTPVQ